MTIPFKTKQRGISFIGVLFVGGLVAVVGVVVAQAIPTVLEYKAVEKAVNKAKDGNTVAEVQSLFDRACAVDNITALKGKDLDVAKVGDKVVVSFAYEREIHLAGPAFLTLKYAGKSK